MRTRRVPREHAGVASRVGSPRAADRVRQGDPLATFAERTMEGLRASELTSLDLDVGRPDHFGPFLGFIGDEVLELRRREPSAKEEREMSCRVTTRAQQVSTGAP
jgi:hypothetical protein